MKNVFRFILFRAYFAAALFAAFKVSPRPINWRVVSSEFVIFRKTSNFESFKLSPSDRSLIICFLISERTYSLVNFFVLPFCQYLRWKNWFNWRFFIQSPHRIYRDIFRKFIWKKELLCKTRHFTFNLRIRSKIIWLTYFFFHNGIIYVPHND